MKKANITNTFLMLFLASCIQVSESPTEESSDNLIGKYPTLSTKIITTKIMPLGDSITLGVNGGYRNGLYSRLIQAGYSFDFVGSENDQYTHVVDKDHEGHPGYTIGDIDQSIVEWITKYKPTHILLMIGTNNVAWWSAKTGSEIADENVLLIRKIIKLLPSVNIICGSPPPLTSVNIQPNNVNRSDLLNSYILAMKNKIIDLKSEGLKVYFADINSSVQLNDLYDRSSSYRGSG